MWWLSRPIAFLMRLWSSPPVSPSPAAWFPAPEFLRSPKFQAGQGPEENPKDFVKPLAGPDVLLLWIGKCRCHRLPMAHNVLDGDGHEVVTAGWVPVGS